MDDDGYQSERGGKDVVVVRHSDLAAVALRIVSVEDRRSPTAHLREG